MLPVNRSANVPGTVAYYVPTIPDVWSTDRYQHCLGLLEAADRSIVLGNTRPPEPLVERATAVRIMDTEGVFDKARMAASAVVDATDGGDSVTFVTSYHYEAALAGAIAKQRGVRWRPDVYETPAQYRLNQPRTYHQITARGLGALLNRADVGIHSFHPETPYQYGTERRFLTNGAPVSLIDPAYHDRSEPRVAWVGSPRLDRGGEILIDALSAAESDVSVDVYGDPDDRVRALAVDRGVDDWLTFHGRVPHSVALDGVRMADVGYCVLPPRTDWKYAPPIKVGEYLAGGTIPLVSDFPGMRYIADEAGVYVRPDAEAVAAALDEIAGLTVEDRRELARAARRRGENIAWERLRAEFARLVGLARDDP